MVEQLNEILEMMTDDPDLFANLAKLMKKYHGELVKAGFTEAEAMTIVANHKVA